MDDQCLLGQRLAEKLNALVVLFDNRNLMTTDKHGLGQILTNFPTTIDYDVHLTLPGFSIMSTCYCKNTPEVLCAHRLTRYLRDRGCYLWWEWSSVTILALKSHDGNLVVTL